MGAQITPPDFTPDPEAFWKDPYPDLERLRSEAPIVRVPLLDNHIMVTKYEDVTELAKAHDRLSNVVTTDPMIRLMGQNLMRKDGDDHQIERHAILPTTARKTAGQVWTDRFIGLTASALNDIQPRKEADMVRDISMRICAEALKEITGLTQITWQEMDRLSQGMMDGISNVQKDPDVFKNCDECVAAINSYVDERIPDLTQQPDHSIISSQIKAGMQDEQLKANVRLAISGGQNEPRDVLAGAVWALLTHPEQLALVVSGDATWHQVFDEYMRWISPIGSIGREVAIPFEHKGVEFKKGDGVLLLLSSANRDEDQFDAPNRFDITRKDNDHVAFSVGSHFCAGAFVSRALIADVALPMIFDRLKGLHLTDDAVFGGWVFRGALQMKVAWT